MSRPCATWLNNFSFTFFAWRKRKMFRRKGRVYVLRMCTHSWELRGGGEGIKKVSGQIIATGHTVNRQPFFKGTVAWDGRLAPAAPESIEWFTEDQAFSPSYDLAPPPPLPPLPSASCLSFSAFLCATAHRSSLLTKEGRGWGPNRMTTRKPAPLQIFQYSLPRSHYHLERRIIKIQIFSILVNNRG